MSYPKLILSTLLFISSSAWSMGVLTGATSRVLPTGFMGQHHSLGWAAQHILIKRSKSIACGFDLTNPALHGCLETYEKEKKALDEKIGRAGLLFNLYTGFACAAAIPAGMSDFFAEKPIAGCFLFLVASGGAGLATICYQGDQMNSKAILERKLKQDVAVLVAPRTLADVWQCEQRKGGGHAALTRDEELLGILKEAVEELPDKHN